MPNTLYLANDGTIHSRPVTNGSSSGRVPSNAYHVTGYETPRTVETHANTYVAQTHKVSAGRKAWFWFVTLLASVFVGAGMYHSMGLDLFGTVSADADGFSNFLAKAAPYIMVSGAVAGCIIYGASFAGNKDYNLWTHFLSALCSVLGVAATCIAVLLLVLIIKILIYIIAIAVVIGILCAAGGS